MSPSRSHTATSSVSASEPLGATRQPLQRGLEIACVAMLYAVPLTVTWTVAGVHIAIGIAAAFAAALAVVRRRWPLVRTSADAAFVAFALAACLSVLFADDSAANPVPLKKLALIPLVHMAAAFLATPHRARTALRLFVFATGTTALVTVVLFLLAQNEEHRLRSTTHYMTWSGLLLLALPMAAAAALGAKPRWRVAYAAATLVLALALLLTQTRSAWLGLVVAACALLARVRARLLWLVPVAAALALLVAPPSYRGRALQTFDWGHHATTDRFEAWRVGWNMWREHPWTGVGLGDLQVLYREHAPSTDKPYGHLHNNWIHILASMGVLGLAAFGWLTWRFAQMVWRAARDPAPAELRALALGAWGSFWGFQIMGLFEWNFGDVEVTITLYFLMGTLVAATRPASRRRPSRGARGLTAVGVAALLLAAGGGCQRGAERTSPADSGSGHQRMLALLAEIARDTPTTHPYLGMQVLDEMRRTVRTLPAEASGFQRWQAYYKAGAFALEAGEVDEAIGYLVRAYQTLPPEQFKQPIGNHTRFRLAVAYMRLGETLNCCQRHTPESCIVPIRGEGIHRRREGSSQAIRYLEEVLNDVDPEDALYFEAQWLFNIAHMTLGGYPDQVPEPLRVPEHVFRSTIAFPRFMNVGPTLGLDNFNLAGGVVVDDFDNDDLLDIVTSTWDPTGEMRFFRNRGDGGFEDRTAEAGLKGLLGGLNMVQADYDNDGNVDILVLRGAWARAAGRHPNSLLHNNGDGTFTDRTFEAGLGEVHYPTQTAAWGDYDNDGDLDLFVGNESSDRSQVDPWSGQENGSSGLRAPSQLFRNDGDGTFTDVAAAAGVENFGYAKGVAWGDYDADGDLDLYVSNLIGPNRLYRNAGDGTFYDMAGPLGVATPTIGFPAWFWDFDNDGVLDLFASSYTGRLSAVAQWHVRGTAQFEAPALYKGDGRGGFVNVTQQAGLARPVLPMGCNFGDLNDDGWLDFYLGTGDPNIESLMPNLMFLNRAGREFVDVTMAGGFGHLQKGHGVAFADLDVDGDTDVYQQMGGAFYGDEYKDALYRNPGFGHHWLGVKLIGVQSNRSAIGARIRLRVTEGGTQRDIYRTVSSGGSFGCSPLRQHIGVGEASSIDELEIVWPTSGRTQRFPEVEPGRWLEIREDAESVRVLEVRPFKLAPQADS